MLDAADTKITGEENAARCGRARAGEQNYRKIVGDGRRLGKHASAHGDHRKEAWR
jgi:hypothetical protein